MKFYEAIIFGVIVYGAYKLGEARTVAKMIGPNRLINYRTMYLNTRHNSGYRPGDDIRYRMGGPLHEDLG